MKPDEITEFNIRDCIKRGLTGVPNLPADMEDRLYAFLKIFQGSVGRAYRYQRDKDAKIARAHSHFTTARLIQKEPE